MRVLATGLLMLGLPLVGVSAEDEKNKLPDQIKAVLDKASEFILYSLEPLEKAEKENALHGWKVLGETTVKDAETRKKLLSALEKSIAKPETGGAKCFDPRHAISVRQDGKAVEVLMCFECGWVYVYQDGKDVAHIKMDTVAQPLYDGILQDARIPLAKKRKE
jgi:hypothetical protein